MIDVERAGRRDQWLDLVVEQMPGIVDQIAGQLADAMLLRRCCDHRQGRFVQFTNEFADFGEGLGVDGCGIGRDFRLAGFDVSCPWFSFHGGVEGMKMKVSSAITVAPYAGSMGLWGDQDAHLRAGASQQNLVGCK